MAFQGRARESVVYLALAGSPATGILYSAVTVEYHKTGATALATKALVSADWVELGAGYYVLKWSADDMDTLGEFFYELTGAGFDVVRDKIEVEPAPLAIVAQPPVCVISGNIVDLGGHPDPGAAVVFRPSKLPSVAAGTSFVSAALIRVTPDAYGNFSVALVRGQQVVVELAPAGLKAQFTVPDLSSAALVDVIPPIP